MKKLLSVAAVLLVAALTTAQADAARTFWTLDFKHTGLHYVTVGSKVYAYTTYEVTNKTGADRKFYPIFRVETNTGKLTYAMPAPEVMGAIRQKHHKNFLDINQVSGPIAGNETKIGAAVLFDLDPAADHVKVYITGITDAFRYQNEDNREGFQRMMWKVHWFRPGDAANRVNGAVETKVDEWVWRSTGVAATAPEEVTETPVRVPGEPPPKPAVPETPEAKPEEKPAEKPEEKPAEKPEEKPAG